MAGPGTGSTDSDELLPAKAAPSWEQRLRHARATIGTEEEPAVLDQLADDVRHERAAVRLAELADSTRPRDRHLALALAARLAEALSLRLIGRIQPLLADRRLAARVRLDATVALVRAIGRDSEEARGLLATSVTGMGKSRAFDWLTELERRLGPAVPLTELRQQIERKLRVSCPLCPVKLHHPELARHLWSEHQLILDGRDVREPWRLIEEWVNRCQKSENGELMHRCEQLARLADPDQGEQRLRRLIARQQTDASLRDEVKAEAADQTASICPYCFALAPVHAGETVVDLTIAKGRIAGNGYVVDVRETGLLPHLEVMTPQGVIFSGKEPGQLLTEPGAVYLLAGPPVVLALVLTVILTILGGHAMPVTLVLLWLAGMAVLTVKACWSGPALVRERAVRHAWIVLVPRLFRVAGFDRAESAFLAGLARLTGGHSRSRKASAWVKQLPGLLALVERGTVAGSCPVSHLAALRRLAIEAEAATGIDALLLVAGQLGRCLHGQLPFAYGEHLLNEWNQNAWTPFQRARLRALLCDRAFEAGYEVRDLLALQQVAPRLADLVQVDEPDSLARLRLLWALRAAQPWAEAGEATTVFELAQDANASFPWLRNTPDLLLLGSEPAPVSVDGQGIIFRGVQCHGTEQRIDVEPFLSWFGVRYRLSVREADFEFSDDPTEVAVSLRAWMHFFEHEFLPRIAEVHTWETPIPIAALRTGEAVECPDCGRAFLTRVGDVGVALGPR